MNLIVEVLPIYYEWLNKDNPGNFGYDGFRMPALRLFLDLGQEITDRVKNDLAVPMFIICSESDQTINHSELQDFSTSAIQKQAKSWYHSFDKIFDIPHTLMTKAEGNKYQDLLITVAKAYIESDITWAEVREIGYQILQGRNFDLFQIIINSIP